MPTRKPARRAWAWSVGSVGGPKSRGIIAVAESGIRTRDDIARLSAAGYHAFLVGERLITQPDPGVALQELRGA